MDEELKKKLNEFADIIQAVQDKNDDLEKKYDGLRKEEVETLSKKAAEMTVAFDKINLERVEEQKRLAELEAIVARGGNGGTEEKSVGEKHDHEVMKWIRKGVQPDHEIVKEGMKSWLRAPGIEEEELEQKTMQVGINPQGGYWVRPERLSKVVSRDFETSPIRSLADVITTSSDSAEMIIDDDEAESGGWTTEIAVRVQTDDPEIGLLQIFAHEQYAEPRITQKLLDDAGFDVGAWLQGKINRIIGRTENTAFVSGDGANKPHGFMDYPAWAVAGAYQRGRIERINSGDANLLTADGLIDLQNALHETYQSNANFVMRRQSWGAVIKFKATGTGAYLIDPTMLRNGAGQLVLLGKPVTFASDLAAIGAGALPVAYGDFRLGYTIVDKIGVHLIRDNITDKGRVKFYTSKRTGGAVTNFDSLKFQLVSA